ncbi:MAG: helix-hairpin-helix domain-containing protein [Myxococcota bacterium]
MWPVLVALVAFSGAARAGRVDVNQASVQELDALPGLGRSKAMALVVHREDHGPYATLDDLLEVSGIGPGTVRAIAPYVTLGDRVLASSSVRPPANEARHPVVPSATRVDPNHASVVELAALPGISGPRAEAILADRERNGPFEQCADLVRVEGIGPATVAALRDLCEVQR